MFSNDPHCLFKLVHSDEKSIEAARAALAGLEGRVPQLRHLEVGVNIVPTERSYDLGLVARFDSLADLQSYLDHPLHVEVVKFLQGNRQSRSPWTMKHPDPGSKGRPWQIFSTPRLQAAAASLGASLQVARPWPGRFRPPFFQAAGLPTVILLHHSQPTALQVNENDSYFHLGRHLRRQGAPVPEIYEYCREEGWLCWRTWETFIWRRPSPGKAGESSWDSGTGRPWISW